MATDIITILVFSGQSLHDTYNYFSEVYNMYICYVKLYFSLQSMSTEPMYTKMFDW